MGLCHHRDDVCHPGAEPALSQHPTRTELLPAPGQPLGWAVPGTAHPWQGTRICSLEESAAWRGGPVSDSREAGRLSLTEGGTERLQGVRLSGHLLTACPTLAQDAQEQELLPARERLGQRTGMNAWGLGESRAAQRSVPPPITGPSIPTRCRGLSTSWALLSSGELSTSRPSELDESVTMGQLRCCGSSEDGQLPLRRALGRLPEGGA